MDELYLSEFYFCSSCTNHLERLILHNPTKDCAAPTAMQNGVEIKTVSAMLGHYDAGFTLKTYTHATRQKQNEAAQVLGISCRRS